MNPKMKELFLKNLMMLGFDKSTYDKLGQYDNISLHKHMFSKPNYKMFEVVTHFLFQKLNGPYTLPWPLLEKSQGKEFQKLTFSYLSTIAKESEIKFPPFTQSVIAMAGRDHFIEVYFAFSCHVLRKCIEAKGQVELLYRPKDPSEDFKKILKLEIIGSVERTQNLIRLSKEHTINLLNCSSDFCTLISSLKSSYLSKKADLDEKKKSFTSLYSKNEGVNDSFDLRNAIKEHFRYEKKVQEHWQTLEKFLAKEQELWKPISSSLEDGGDNCFLDSSLVDLSTLRDLMNELAGTKLESQETIEKETPSLIRFLKLFGELLKSLLQTYLTGESTNLHEHSKLENSWSLDENQKEMIAFRNKIFRCLIDVKKSTKIFRGAILDSQCAFEMETFTKEVQNWAFCSKSFFKEVDAARAEAFLPSKFSQSFIVTESYKEPGPIHLSDLETLDTSGECSSPKLDGVMNFEKEVSTAKSIALKSLVSCEPPVDLSFDFHTFGFSEPGRKSDCLENMSLLDVSLPDDDV